jgi:DNA-binding NtrC family response regulator
VKNTVLLVGPGACRRVLTSNLETLGMETLFVNDWRQARQTLDARPDITVAVTALTLGDGNWSDVVQHAAQRNFQTAVVVVSRTGSARLWAELLWRGAHDLLVEPLNSREVRQTIEGAVRAAEEARNRMGARMTVPGRAAAPGPIAAPGRAAASASALALS